MEIKLPASSESDQVEIIKVLVSEGEEVQPDQTLVETSAGILKSPKRAKVARVHVTPGSKIKQGESAVSLEDPKDKVPESRVNSGLEEGPISVSPKESLMEELEPP